MRGPPIHSRDQIRTARIRPAGNSTLRPGRDPARPLRRDPTWHLALASRSVRFDDVHLWRAPASGWIEEEDLKRNKPRVAESVGAREARRSEDRPLRPDLRFLAVRAERDASAAQDELKLAYVVPVQWDLVARR